MADHVVLVEGIGLGPVVAREDKQWKWANVKLPVYQRPAKQQVAAADGVMQPKLEYCTVAVNVTETIWSCARRACGRAPASHTSKSRQK